MISDPHWNESAIRSDHDRGSFDCGKSDLNLYLQRYARQNHRSSAYKCFVAEPSERPSEVIGFYTLSPASLVYTEAPATVKRGLGRYDVPVFRLGRLAVDRNHQRRGIGGELLLSAGRRANRVAEEIGGVALLIDAKHEQAAHWYAGFGAEALADRPLTLVLPLRAIVEAG